MAVFLDHMMIARIVINPVTEAFSAMGIALQTWQTGLIYFVLMMLYSLFTSWLVDSCTAAWRRKRQPGIPKAG